MGWLLCADVGGCAVAGADSFAAAATTPARRSREACISCWGRKAFHNVRQGQGQGQGQGMCRGEAGERGRRVASDGKRKGGKRK